MTWVFGYARNRERPCTTDPANSERTLCGLLVQGTPPFDDAPDYTPTDLCDKCRNAMWGHTLKLPAPAVKVTGTCPECGGLVELEDGLVVKHGVHIRRGVLVVESEVRCDGADQRPEVDA